MPKLVDNYVLCTKIGAGQFGEVLKGYDRTTNNDIAVKVIKRENLKGKFIQLLQNQIKVLKACDNINIIKLYDLKKTPNNFYLILEYCNEGDLQAYVKKKKHLTEDEAVQFLIEIFHGFKTLVKNKIMHRDFKLANILLHNGEIKIADFGFSKLLTEEEFTKTQLGSPLNMAPEILNGQKYTNKADIYSIGVCFYEMLFGKPPYNAANMVELAKKIKKGDIEFPRNINKISQLAQNLIRRMLIPDPNKRIDWNELFDHPITRTLEQNMQNQLTTTLGQGGNLLANISKFYIRQNMVILHPTEFVKKEQINNYAFEMVKNNKKLEYKGEGIKRLNSKSEQRPSKLKRQQIVGDKIQQKQSESDLILKAIKANTKYLLNERNKLVFILSILNQLKERTNIAVAKQIADLIVQDLMSKVNKFSKVILDRENIYKLEYWAEYIENQQFELISKYFEKQNTIINYEFSEIKKIVVKASAPLNKLVKLYALQIIDELKATKKTNEQASRVSWIHIDHLMDYRVIDTIMKVDKETEFNFKLYYLENGKISMEELIEKVNQKLSKQ